jgi:hypothetical protein
LIPIVVAHPRTRPGYRGANGLRGWKRKRSCSSGLHRPRRESECVETGDPSFRTPWVIDKRPNRWNSRPPHDRDPVQHGGSLHLAGFEKPIRVTTSAAGGSNPLSSVSHNPRPRGCDAGERGPGRREAAGTRRLRVASQGARPRRGVRVGSAPGHCPDVCVAKFGGTRLSRSNLGTKPKGCPSGSRGRTPTVSVGPLWIRTRAEHPPRVKIGSEGSGSAVSRRHPAPAA